MSSLRVYAASGGVGAVRVIVSAVIALWRLMLRRTDRALVGASYRSAWGIPAVARGVRSRVVR